MNDLTADLMDFSLFSLWYFPFHSGKCCPTTGNQGRIGDSMVEGLHQEGVMSVGGTSSNSPTGPRVGPLPALLRKEQIWIKEQSQGPELEFSKTVPGSDSSCVPSAC